MRAWLLILAVLATLQITTQVASTEDQQIQEIHQKQNSNPDLENSSSPSPPPPSTSSYSLPVIVNTSTSKLSDSLSDDSNQVQGDSEDESQSDDDSLSYHREKITLKPDTENLVEVQNTLLQLIGLKRRPRNLDRSKIIIPEAMKKLYAEIMGQELDSINIPKPGLHTKTANTVRSFSHQESKIDKRFPHHHKFRLSFNLSSIPENEKLKAAELQINRDAIDLSKSSSHSDSNSIVDLDRTRYQVFVYDILKVGIKGQREPSFRLIDTKHILLNSTDVLSFDVQPAVERWLATPKTNHGLLIEVRTSGELKPAPHHHVRLRRSLDEHDELWLQKQPILYTYTDDERFTQHVRERRDVSSSSSSSSSKGGHHQNQHQKRTKRQNKRKPYNKRIAHHEACQRKALYVDFSEVGWSDWIVAPNGYDAFYCGGECPKIMSGEFNTTNHAILQQMINQNNPEKVPKACCVPTQLAPISMLFLNEDNHVVLKSYQDMAVVGCGCR